MTGDDLGLCPYTRPRSGRILEAYTNDPIAGAFCKVEVGVHGPDRYCLMDLSALEFIAVHKAIAQILVQMSIRGRNLYERESHRIVIPKR